MLDGLISEALGNNKNVKIAVASTEQAVGVLEQTRANIYKAMGGGWVAKKK